MSPSIAICSEQGTTLHVFRRGVNVIMNEDPQ